MDDLTGKRLDGYELLRLLGRGAMASVYLAEQASLGRRVAIKVLDAELSRDEAYVARFRHEARSAASLAHPGIVQVYEIGRTEIDSVERYYIAQEYVPGGTLGRLLARESSLPAGRVLSVMWQVGSALAAAAEQGLVHRDIKPDNLMIDRSGAIKVTDFGLARGGSASETRLTQAGVALGTPLYMSPEQIEGREIDSRSDLYSLGVTCYQLLTGETPFTGDAPLAVAVQHLNQDPDPIAARRPGAPVELCRVIERLLAKSPENRFASPGNLLESLRQIAREAEAMGWADEQYEITQTEVLTGALASEDGRHAVERLNEAMLRQKESGDRDRRAGRRLIAAAITAGVIGVALAFWQRPTPVMRVGAFRAVERAETVQEQLYLAKLSDTPAAWEAVGLYYPETDPYYRLLALRGQAICHLRRGQNFAALRALDQMNSLAGDEGDFVALANAGLVLAYSRLGRDDAAREARGRMVTASASPVAAAAGEPLTNIAPDLFDEFQRSLEKLDLAVN